MIDPTAAPDADYARYPSLVDRTCLVTGGADGIGAGIVTELAAQGAKVAFLDLQADKAADLVAACDADGVPHTPVYRIVDLRDIEAMQVAIAELAAEVGADRDSVVTFLESDEGLDDVADDLRSAYENGITAVPTYVFNGEWAVPGAQDPSMFAKVIERLAQQALSPST